MLRKRTNDQDPADWFAFAKERLRSVEILSKDAGVTAAGIELLQEGIERYLKGYLIAKGWALVKTHDLERLVKEAGNFHQDFSKFLPFAIELTEDFFAQHYPGEDTTNVGNNFDSLRKQADHVVQLIERELPQFFTTPTN